ncbi:MAG: glycosyl hydrolase, partial [Gemmatimonadota bacterium]
MSLRLPRWPALALLLPLLLPIRPVVGQSAGTPVVNQAADPMLQGFRWRSIGPVGQGGRVDDLAVNPNDASEYYVGFATGGIWKTTNGGTTFTAIFDSYQTHSIGDLALAPSNPQILYVGTGEPNNRQSSSFGYGMYRSNDGGQTFAHLGLEQTQSIARVVVHPTNPDIVWVAAMGHLFGPNDERGVYQSTDGGKSWRKVLFVDQHTGATDLVIHPTNPQILWAATYQRQRTAFGFAGGGPGSGIWKSENGGDTWTRVAGAGLPAGTMGRIGLDISRSNPQVIYSQIEVG